MMSTVRFASAPISVAVHKLRLSLQFRNEAPMNSVDPVPDELFVRRLTKYSISICSNFARGKIVP